MTMTTYTIQIWNQSLVGKSYALLTHTPEVTSRRGSLPVYTNAWATFADVTNGGFDRISFTDEVYAYWSDPPGDRLLRGGVMAVNTTTQDTVNFIGGSPTGFATLVSPGTAQAGSFSIVTGTDFTPVNAYVLGLARIAESPIPVPAATFAAAPNEVYNVTPVSKFYVVDGAYTPGELIDATAATGNAAVIDFTGRPQTTATVIQGANGTFTVTYN